MAITDKKTGPWGLDQVYNKINQGSIWSYSDPDNLFAWGNNPTGGLGQNNTTNYSSPIQLPGTTNVWASLAMGDGAGSGVNISAIKTNGTLWSWGSNTYGQLGQNNKTQYSSPVQIPGTTWSLVSIGNKTSIATKTDGTLWTWGDNGYGQLGTNQAWAQIKAASSPVQIPGTSWSRPSPNIFWNVYAVRTNGTLWAWGRGGSGRMAQNIEGDGQDRSSPTQIPGTSWSRVCAVGGACLAIRTNGTLWAWGGNNAGQLGQNTPTYYSSPIQIPGTNWSDVRAGDQTVIALKTDGTLYSWGAGNSGILGTSSIAEVKSPVQIPGTTWSKIRVGSNLAVALKTDGTLWSWGNGYNGGTGQNLDESAGRFSSPVQIGTDTTWTDISISGTTAYAVN